VVNNCGKHSKQWVETYVDEYDWTYKISVQPGARYENGWSLRDYDDSLAIKLGPGVFCGDHVTVVYRKGSTWRPSCR
jgi:hypothetical protein